MRKNGGMILPCLAVTPGFADESPGPLRCSQCVQVGEARQDIFPAQAVPLTVHPCPPEDAVGRMTVVFPQGVDPAVMKLVATDPGADGEKRVFSIHNQGRISVSLRSLLHSEHNG
jgi:hypothetical protein